MSLRILLADESITIKKVMQLALQEYDVEVRSVPVGSDVVQIAKNFQPEIIFADVLLAKKNGYDVCADMKSEPGLNQIPFVLMWSGFLDFDEARAQQVHPEDRLEKPFDAETLRQLVKKLVPRLSGNPLQDHLIFPEMPEIIEDQKKDLTSMAEKLATTADVQKPQDALIKEESILESDSDEKSMTSTILTPMSSTASVTATASMTDTQNFKSALFEPHAPIQLDPLDALEKEITAQKKSSPVKLPEIPEMEDEPEEFQQVSLSMTKSRTEALWNEDHPANYQYQEHDDDEALTRNMVLSDEVSFDNMNVATMGEDSISGLEEISIEAAEALTGSRSASGKTSFPHSSVKDPQELSQVLDQEQIQAMVQEEVQRRVQEVLEDIAWKVIPEIAEKIIQRDPKDLGGDRERSMTLFELIRAAIKEDMPRGDLTSECLGLPPRHGTARLIAKQDLILSGATAFEQSIQFLEPNVRIKWHFEEGQKILQKQNICTLQGDLIQILKAERVALNFLMHLSGIATYTAMFVDQVKNTKTKILDTRKTLPGYRELEKKAVLHGGGQSHRLNLSTSILIKDNHIALAGGVREAIERIRRHTHLPLDVEACSLDEVQQAVDCNVEHILLDNMDNDTLTKALRLIPSHIRTEASGNMTLSRVQSVAALGVDFISVGALTHSAPSADISLKFDW